MLKIYSGYGFNLPQKKNKKKSDWSKVSRSTDQIKTINCDKTNLSAINYQLKE